MLQEEFLLSFGDDVKVSTQIHVKQMRWKEACCLRIAYKLRLSSSETRLGNTHHNQTKKETESKQKGSDGQKQVYRQVQTFSLRE